MAKSRAKNKGVSQGMAIISLVVNLFLPGLGTLIAGDTKTGVWQLVLALVSMPLRFVLIGYPIFLGAWIWALITSIKLVQKSSK